MMYQDERSKGYKVYIVCYRLFFIMITEIPVDNMSPYQCGNIQQYYLHICLAETGECTEHLKSFGHK